MTYNVLMETLNPSHSRVKQDFCRWSIACSKEIHLVGEWWTFHFSMIHCLFDIWLIDVSGEWPQSGWCESSLRHFSVEVGRKWRRRRRRTAEDISNDLRTGKWSAVCGRPTPTQRAAVEWEKSWWERWASSS